MKPAISKLEAQIERLKKRRAELVTADRKARERRLLALAEKHGLLALPLEQLEALFVSLPFKGEANVQD